MATMSVITKVVQNFVTKQNKIILARLCTKQNYSRHAAKLANNRVNKLTRLDCHAITNFTKYYRRVSTHSTHSAVDEEKDETETEVFIQTENNFARQLLEESMHYRETMMKPFKTKMVISDSETQQILSLDYSEIKASELLPLLKKLSYHALNKPTHVNCDDYNNILSALSNISNTFTNTELIEVLRYLVPLNTILKSHEPFNKLCVTLDILSKKRLKTFSKNETFVLCDIFSKLHNPQHKVTFLWNAVLKLGSRPSKLSPQNVVQLCYFINLCRKTPINMYELEYRMEQFIEDISLNELGIIAMGFFKSKNRIRSTILSHAIMQKLITNIDSVESISLASIMKLFRYSIDTKESTMFRMMLKTLEPYISKYNLMTTTHIAHACIKLQIFEKDVMATILDRFQKELKNARIKDMERMVYIMSMFNYEPTHPLYHNIIEELRTSHRQTEIINYRKVLPYLLQYLTYVNIYPLDLIRIVLDDSYIKTLFKSNFSSPLTLEFLVLDYGLRIEVPEYTGPFLNKNIKENLLKKHSTFYHQRKRKSSKVEKLISEIVHIGNKVVESDSALYTTQILPHVQSEQIIIAVDKTGKIVPAEPLLSSAPSDTLQYVNCGDLKDFKFIAIVPNSFTFKGSENVKGLISMQIRHLKALGYEPILLLQTHWDTIQFSNEKEEFFRNLIKKQIKS